MRRHGHGAAAALFGVVAVVAGALAAPAYAVDALTVLDLTDSGVTAASLANVLAGPGVTISNVAYSGAPLQAGTFSGGTNIVGFDQGIVLSSGTAKGAVGPNSDSAFTGDLSGYTTSGDADLTALIGDTTYDASVLTFDLSTSTTPLTFRYVFSSDEYNEYVGQFNDAFALFVNGTNCAVVPDPNNPGQTIGVSVNTVNNTANSSRYVDNTDGHLNTQMDGLTTALTCTAPVSTSQPNTIKLAIADALDDQLDSDVFIEAGSFSTVTPDNTSTTYGGATSVQYSDPLSVSGTLMDTTASPSVPVAGKSLSFTMGSQSTTGTTDGSGLASSSITVTQAPAAYNLVTAFAGDTGFNASSDTDSVTVTKEDCALTWTGSGATVPAGGSTSLAVSMADKAPDTSPGDHNGKSIDFAVDDGSTVTHVPATTSGDSASVTQNLPTGVYTITASFAGDSYYNSCDVQTLVTVEAAAPAGKVTGGGFVVDDGRTSFGFNAMSDASGLHGQLQVRTPGHDRFHGETVSTLSVSGATATWSGTGRWDGQDGYSYTISVADNGTGGGKKGGDTITITLKQGSTVVFSATGALKGGNITVHS